MPKPVEIDLKLVVWERFWPKVNKTDTCWLWTGAKTEGYGIFSLVGRKNRRAHRITYVMEYGSIPAGFDVDHKCHVRACVRPEHLRAVTHKQNLEHRLGAQVTNPSGVRGVSWDKVNKKWSAQVSHNGRTYNCGRFLEKADAAEAARLKRVELFTHNDRDKAVSSVVKVNDTIRVVESTNPLLESGNRHAGRLGIVLAFDHPAAGLAASVTVVLNPRHDASGEYEPQRKLVFLSPSQVELV